MDKNKRVDSTPAITPAATPKTSCGGIEPGQLRGGVAFRGISPDVDRDAEILKEVDAMDGKQLYRWLKVAGNKEALEKAHHAKGRTR